MTTNVMMYIEFDVEKKTDVCKTIAFLEGNNYEVVSFHFLDREVIEENDDK